jgi:hypothetical protein
MTLDDEINEKNIDRVLNYLKIFHPDKATPEMATHILESMAIGAHRSVVHGEKVELEKAIEQALKDTDEIKH